MLKKSTIVPKPKKNKITCLNEWSPVALTPIFSKCFEKLIRDYICAVLPAWLDPLQFAYRSNRSTDDAIAFTLHTALSHLENNNTYVRMLFVGYSSGFNTIVPATLVCEAPDFWDWTYLCAAGSWTSWQAAVRWSEWATIPHLPWPSTPMLLRAASSAHSCTPCIHLTVQPHTQLHHQICWWHNGDRPDHWQRWDVQQRGGEYPDKMVSGELPLT